MAKLAKGTGMWTRATGPNLSPESVERGKKNKSVLESTHFIKACENVGIEPTLRQASKFRRKMGLAYLNRER